MLSALKNIARSSWISVLLVASILGGAVVGHQRPAAGEALGNYVGGTLLMLVALLFFGVRFEAVVRAWGNLRFLGLTLLATYLFVPVIGYAIASVALSAYPLFMVGLVIYFMSPCTDWFLGFTRLAGGNVALGAVLIPINMVLQLLLYPVYLYLFTRNAVPVQADVIGSTLLHWFFLPFAVGVAAHYFLRRLLVAERFDRLLRWADLATPWVIALLVVEIFAGNIAVILQHSAVFGWVLLAVFVFFVATFLLGEAISRLGRLAYPEHALLTMTIAARNAPLMLAVTMVALPGQPLVYAAIVIGMLVEFPHLALLQRVLLGWRGQHGHVDSLGPIPTPHAVASNGPPRNLPSRNP